MIEMPVIDPEKCDGCGLCIDVCHCHALVLVGKIISVNTTQECDWCTEWEIVCITGALSCPFEIVIE